MNKVRFSVSIVLLFVMPAIMAQSEGLTSSPYSLYGLGAINQTSIGKTNGMGYSGIGLKTDGEINNLNAANFALIPKNSFFYDVGLKGQYNTYSNRINDESKTTINFSNLAVAFRIADDFGAGIVMVPYTDVGYSLVGIQTNIEGTNQTFESNVSGVGGLSDLRLNLGYGIIEGLRIGANASLLFGNIEEEESFTLGSSSFDLTEKTNYTGVRWGLGMQFDFTDDITLGSTVQFPTALKGNLKRSVLKNIDATDITVESETSDDTADFNMPLELGLGFSARLFKSLTVSADYKNNFWSDTGQTENLGTYVDQSIYAVGLEFVKKKDSYKYGDRIRYRAGYNYDTGYLSVNGSKIDGQSFTAGIGIPVGQGQRSMLNLSYSYGSQGQIQNILVKENFHLLTLNLSLQDVWFQKRKIN
ncbi:OmpP1/FadL family transporter [Pseudozobellia thermophila]|nr:outer membrane protein transport protein [Pseudozobellia thermophila]